MAFLLDELKEKVFSRYLRFVCDKLCGNQASPHIFIVEGTIPRSVTWAFFCKNGFSQLNTIKCDTNHKTSAGDRDEMSIFLLSLTRMGLYFA